MSQSTANAALSAMSVQSPSPEDSLRSLLAKHDAQLVEGAIGPNVTGWFGRVLGRLTFIFPAGQDPALTLRVAQGFVGRQGYAVQA